jgi:hypothetical protein
MTPMDKVKVFWPQLAWLAVATAAWTEFARVQGAMIIPLAVAGAAASVVTFVTAINKSVWFLDNGWPVVERRCSSCAHLTRELAETREALATLRLEETER